jgi:streptogramin lyase
METTTMFSGLMPRASIRASQDHQGIHRGHGERPNRRPLDRGRARTRFRLEALEERCLLSGVSGITEFAVPSVSGATDGITAGPDGNLWFTEAGSDAIGMINPTTHAISSFTLPTANADPQGITAGPDGNLWFTEFDGDKIGVINPTTHAISEFPTPTANSGPLAITAGPNGDLWFTELHAHQVGEINPTTDAITEFALPAAVGYIGGYGITAGPDGNVWFTWGARNHLGQINPTTDVVTWFPVNGNAYGITAGPDGNLWFTAGGGYVGEFNPSTDAESLFAVGSLPLGITAGPDGNLWLAESGAGEIASISPTTDAVTQYSIPYGGSSPAAITTGPDGDLWFTDYGTSAIGVATLTTSQLVVTTQPPASVTAGSGFGFTVTAENSAGSPITSFNGTVKVAIGSNPGGATLGGTLTATASNGVATFAGLTLTTAASGYTLEVSAAGLASGATSSITITPAAATQLVITQQPPATVKVSTGFGLQASIEDQYGNVVTTASNTVSVAFANNRGGATLGGTLSDSASQGVAMFSGLTINKTGDGYTLQVSSSGLSSAVTSAIDVTKTGNAIVVAGAAATTAPDPVLGPLVFDAAGFLSTPGLKKRFRN